MKRRFSKKNVERVRSGPGVYKLYAKGAKKPTYVGSSNNLNRRLGQHGGQHFHTFQVVHTTTTRQAKSYEKRLIRRHNPRRNKIKYE